MARLNDVIGVARMVLSLTHLAITLRDLARRTDDKASDAMIDEMRADVPVDSGRLLNGIRAYREGDETVVEASAVRGDFDYAFIVEKGRLADSGYFAPEPFFHPAVEDVLAERGRRMDDVIDEAAGIEGLR